MLDWLNSILKLSSTKDETINNSLSMSSAQKYAMESIMKKWDGVFKSLL